MSNNIDSGGRGAQRDGTYELMRWSIFYLALDPSDRYYVA